MRMQIKNLNTYGPCQQWTWGESLTQDEVQSLCHTSKKRVRSGYETSLKPGVHDGEWSSQDSAPTHTGRHHSLLSADPHRSPPPTSLIYPEKFNSSNVQATPSGSHIHADIGAGIQNLQATASGADIGIIGTDIQRLPNLPCISTTIIADMCINVTFPYHRSIPSPSPCVP